MLGLGSVEINWIRIWDGLPRGWAFVSGFLTPDFLSRGADIREGISESLTMTLTSTVIGVLISVPIGIGAARNLTPAPVYLLCRAIIALSRSFQEVIIAILFVAMVGFGPLAGFLTLAFATIGFLSKLLAEDIEDIDEAQAEAIRATGAGWLQLYLPPKHLLTFSATQTSLCGLHGLRHRRRDDLRLPFFRDHMSCFHNSFTQSPPDAIRVSDF